MDTTTERDLNQAAFRQLKQSIAETYPRGRYVAISEGRIVADASTFAELHFLLKSMGKNPVHVLIVQAGLTETHPVAILAGRSS